MSYCKLLFTTWIGWPTWGKDLSLRALIMVSESSSQYWQALVNVKNYYRLVFNWNGLHLRGKKKLIGRVFFKIIIRKWERKWCLNFLLDYSSIVYKNLVNFIYWKCGKLNLGNLGLCYVSCQWIYHQNYLFEERGARKNRDMFFLFIYLFFFEKQTHPCKRDGNEIWS